MAHSTEHSWRIFASCTPGMEAVVVRELQDLTDVSLQVEEGGVELSGSLLDAAGLALWARTPAAILVRIGAFRAKSLQQLHVEAKKLPWSDVLSAGQPVKVRATLKGSSFKRADSAARKLELAIQDALRHARTPFHQRRNRFPLSLVLRANGSDVTISADAVGRPLHRRGYRKATAKAPLRENLAASVLVASGWDPESEALADPMCGAGTFGIEAAWMARDRAPGRDLKPAVIEWPGFPRKGFHQLQRELELGNVSNTVRIFSSDRNEGALKAARANAQRAGVEGDIRFQCQSINDPVELDCERGLVVLNPPYGKRIGDLSRLHGLYKHFSKGLVQNYPGWRIAVVCPDKALAGRLAPGIQEVTRFRNGGIPVGLYLGEIPQSQK